MTPMIKIGDCVKYLGFQKAKWLFTVNEKEYYLSNSEYFDMCKTLARLGIRFFGSKTIIVEDRIAKLSGGLPKVKEGDTLIYKGFDEKDGRILLINNVKHILNGQQTFVMSIILERDFGVKTLFINTVMVLAKPDASWMEAFE